MLIICSLSFLFNNFVLEITVFHVVLRSGSYNGMQCNSQIAEYNADDLVLFSFNQIPDNFSC